MSFKMTTVLGVVGFAILAATSASAQTCGGTYQVQSGDSLSAIADRLYKDAGKWTAIHQNNVAKLGERADRLLVGMKLDLLCINGLPVGLEGGQPLDTAAAAAVEAAAPKAEPLSVKLPSSAALHKLTFITSDDYAPFTDRKLPEGGMMTDVVQQVMAEAAPPQGFSVQWVNDWSAHLDTLLPQGLVDASFPWFKPRCETNPEEYRCQNFLFSDPLFEVLELAYVDTTKGLKLETDADFEGKTLCRMSGYAAWALDQDGRNWVKDSKIKLERPARVGDCFQMLVDGKVDVVMIDEFAGRAALRDMGLSDRVKPLERPLSVETIHLLVSKTDPEGQAIMEMFNLGMKRLRDKGAYQRLIGAHLSRIWSEG